MSDQGMTDADIFSATPQAVPAPVAAPAMPHPAAPQGDPAVWTLLGEGGTDPHSLLAVGSTVANRAKTAGKSFQDVVTDPGQGYEAWNDPAARARVQKQFPVGSPAYLAAQGVLSDLQSGKVQPLPYTHFYGVQTYEQRHGQGAAPSWAQGQGVDVGGNRFYALGAGGSGLGQAPPPGLTPEEEKVWESLQPGAPTTQAGQTPAPGNAPVRGAQGQPLTAAQVKWYSDHQPEGGWTSSPGAEGTSALPYPLQPGSPIPTTPGAHYVDFDGVEHIVPGGLAEKLAGIGRGFVQGAIMDPANSAIKLTGGGIAVDPMAAALSQTQGGPGAFETAQAAQQGAAQQERNYGITNLGNEYAQGGRFGGQATTATALTAAVPELKLPGMAAKALPGIVTSVLERGGTNALRGLVATAPTVSTSNAPVGEQLATGAVAGAVVPPLAGAAGRLGAKAAGLTTPEIAPEVRALADKAINDYKIPLRASQIGGTAEPSLGVKDSNLINAPGSGFASNDRAQRQAFTRAVAGTFGAQSDKITPQVMDSARKALGAKFDVFAKGHSIQDAGALSGHLDAILNDARQVMPASELAPLENQVGGIKSLAQNNQISGEAYQRLVAKGSPLDRAMQSGDSNVRYYAQQVRDALDDGIMQSASPGEIADFRNTRLQYKNLMTLKGLAAKAGITGEISPTQLQGVVNRSFDDRAFSGAGPLGELADIGQMFMKSPPNSFTAQRAAEIAGRNALPTALAGLAGGEFGLAHDPALAAKIAAGAVAAKASQYGVNALQGLRYGAGAGASMINGQSGVVGNALQGIRRAADISRPAQVPLSALGANFLINAPQGAAVGANP